VYLFFCCKCLLTLSPFLYSVPVRVLKLMDAEQGYYEIAILHQITEDELSDDSFESSDIHVVHSNRLARLPDSITTFGLTQWLNDWTTQSDRNAVIELKHPLKEYFGLETYPDSAVNIQLLRQEQLLVEQFAAEPPTAIRKRPQNNISKLEDDMITERLSQHADNLYPITVPYVEPNPEQNLFIALPHELLSDTLAVWNFCFSFRYVCYL
jgi:hypothetical protein